MANLRGTVFGELTVIRFVGLRRSHRFGNTNSSTHGMSNTPEYHAWEAMKQRCADPKNPKYKNYGASYDPSWEESLNFYVDMGKRPAPNLTLERKDNCAWVTMKEQANNTRRNISGVWT